VRWWVPRDGALPGRIRATCRGTIWGRAEGRSWPPGRPRRPDLTGEPPLYYLRSYAKYDFPRLLNSLMEALRWDRSVLERTMAKLMSVPARRLLRSRRVTFLASHDAASGRPLLVRGTYQSPILVQWQPADEQSRTVEIAIVGLS
jgi:hypothetical protein